MDYSRPPLADELAAAYVCGNLRGPARRRYEALLPAHPALRTALLRWQAALLPLSAVVPEVQPPAEVWSRIERQLGLAPQPQAAMPWWQTLGVWRTLSGLSSAAVLGLAVLLVQPTPVAAPLIVVLESTAANPADAGAGAGTGGGAVTKARFVASISPDGRAVATRALLPVDVAADRTLELWAVPPEGAPRSLGLMRPEGALLLPQQRVPLGTRALAVSLEPSGGSPTGVPTGPVLFVGKLGA